MEPNIRIKYACEYMEKLFTLNSLIRKKYAYKRKDWKKIDI